MADFNAQKVSKVSKSAAADPDASFSVEGTDGGTFAIASSKKELKQLMKSDADLVYDQKKGKLFLNENSTKKGWGKRKLGGLMARFRGMPELSVDNFEGLLAHKADAITGAGSKKGGGKKGGGGVNVVQWLAKLDRHLNDDIASLVKGDQTTRKALLDGDGASDSAAAGVQTVLSYVGCDADVANAAASGHAGVSKAELRRLLCDLPMPTALPDGAVFLGRLADDGGGPFSLPASAGAGAAGGAAVGAAAGAARGSLVVFSLGHGQVEASAALPGAGGSAGGAP